MSESEFKKYNKSRASTKRNFIKRHGKVEGERLWNEYKERQSYTKSLQYQIDLHGEEEGRKKFAEINAKKVNDINSFINRYGFEEGVRKFKEYTQRGRGISYAEQKFITHMREMLTLYEDQESHSQYVFMHECGAYAVDYYNKEMKLVVEYNGDYWHMNPKIFKADDFIKQSGVTAKEIWAKDEERLNFLRNHNKIDKVIVVWESEEEQGLQEIREYVEEFRKRR